MRQYVCLVGLVGGLGALMLACPPSSSGPDENAEPAVVSGYRRFLSALCAYDERCALIRGRQFTTVERCQEAVDRELIIHAAAYQDLAKVYGVDPDAMATCEGALAAASCNQRLPQEVVGCANALAPANPRDVGEGCSNQSVDNSPRCDRGGETWCNLNADGSGCGLCVGRKPNGTDCATNDECLSGYCNAPLLGNRRCETLPVGKFAGEGCLETLECSGNLVCAGPFLQKRCAARALAGQQCSSARNGEQPTCVSDLVCVIGTGGGGTCAQPLDDGRACARTPSTTNAVCRNFCVFDSPTAANGTCGTLTAMPGAGQPCAVAQVNGAVLNLCDTTQAVYVDAQPGDGGVMQGCACTARGPQGTACMESPQCLSAECHPDAGTCTAPHNTSEPCTSNENCASGFCRNQGGMQTCQPLPICP